MPAAPCERAAAPTTRTSPTDALRSPVFFLALAVLVVNDHALKGAGVLPGWLTGKLSDFAWLVVAPVALATLLGVRRRLTAALVVGGISALFVATELSQALADEVAALATALGQPTRLWADPTDLLALSVLPLTWHLLRGPAAVERPWPAARAAFERVALGAAIFASVATSPPPPPAPTTWATSAYVANTTADPIAVRVRFAAADLDCSLLRSIDLADAVSRDLFDTGITFRLLPQETVPIEPQAATFAATGGPPGATPMPANPCDLVLLSTDGAPDTIVLVSGARGTAPTTLGSGAVDTVGPGRRVDVAARADGTLGFGVGAELPSALLDERTPPSDCALARPTFAHSVGRRTGTFTLLSTTVGADGCTAAAVRDGAGASRTFFFCVPEAYFPFLPGDELTLTNGAVGTSVRGPAGTLAILDAETTSLDAVPFTLTAAAHETCTGTRLGCGAYVLPREVEVDVTSGTPAGTPETELVVPTASGGTARLRIGAVESTVIAPAGCDAAHATVGTRINAVVLIE